MKNQFLIINNYEKIHLIKVVVAGIMVFEALCPEFDFSDDTIQKIQGILETNKKEIRLTQSDCEALYATACLLEHSCQPNVKITFEKDLSVSKKSLKQKIKI